MLMELWEERFVPLNDDYAPLAAPDVWAGLDHELFAPRRRRNRIFWLVVAGFAVALVVKLAFWARLLM